jgi:hypothetical protein
MRRLVPALILLTACSSGAEPLATTTTTTSVTAAVPTATTTTTTLPSSDPCGEPTVRPAALPERVFGTEPEVGDVVLDRFTLIPGTTTQVWTDERGAPVMALIRGSLPPEQWTGPVTRVEVAGSEGALGPLSDGVWAVAWYESDERCDLYTLVLYPPTSPEEAEAVAASLLPTR